MTGPRKPHYTPLFIVIEGIDGSGSTTQGDMLTDWLRKQGYRAYFTHEPSSGPAGMMIRLALARRLLGPNGESHSDEDPQKGTQTALDPHALALLYAADRMDHLATEILPNLESGRIVVCDRYVLSTLAYQGMSIDETWLMQINAFARKPDLTIYLDLSVEHALHRMRRTRWTRDLFEDEDTLKVIRFQYEKLLRSHADVIGPYSVIDASLPQVKVAKSIRERVSRLLPEAGSPLVEPALDLFPDTGEAERN